MVWMGCLCVIPPSLTSFRRGCHALAAMANGSPALAVTLALAVAAGAQEPPILDLMRRVHAYVAVYEDHVLSGMVAEEIYRQQVLESDGSVRQQRRLVSEYVILQLPPDEAWYGFRNVIEVDGEPLPDRAHRLEEIFTSQRTNHPVDDAMQLAEESAQFNVGNVYRTVNLPTFVLSFLRPANRKRLAFEDAGREEIEGTPTWIVSFREQKDSSFIATPKGKDLKTRGRFWAEPSSGRVIQTELDLGPDRGIPWKAKIVVTYRRVAERDAWLPAEMHETYENTRQRRPERVTGEATYANYRPITVRKAK